MNFCSKIKSQENHEVTHEPMQGKMPCLASLFSGCGGMDKGFADAGFRIAYANDFDKDAQAVYRLNLGEIDGRDIREVPAEDIPDCDVIAAGFPCQPFSTAGLRKGTDDPRGMLYKECLRIIGRKMPKAVVFENVRGILSAKGPSGNSLAEAIAADLGHMGGVGYDVEYKLLNASDYGVPQNRMRVIFVGIRRDLGTKYEFPEPIPKRGLTLRHALDIPALAANQADWPLSPQAREMAAHIPEGGSWKDVPYDLLPARLKRIRDDMRRYHSPNFYRRYSRDEICGTITASAQPENCGIIHPTEDRRLNIREIARIQSFPDDFLFLDDSMRSIAAMYKVIGNAVPVRLAKAIAESIAKTLNDCMR